MRWISRIRQKSPFSQKTQKSPFSQKSPFLAIFPIFNHFPQNPKIHYFLQFPCFPKNHHFFGILPIFLFFIILSIIFRNHDILYPNKKMIIFLFCQKISFFYILSIFVFSCFFEHIKKCKYFNILFFWCFFQYFHLYYKQDSWKNDA